jgi:hypothetical protein
MKPTVLQLLVTSARALFGALLGALLTCLVIESQVLAQTSQPAGQSAQIVVKPTVVLDPGQCTKIGIYVHCFIKTVGLDLTKNHLSTLANGIAANSITPDQITLLNPDVCTRIGKYERCLRSATTAATPGYLSDEQLHTVSHAIATASFDPNGCTGIGRFKHCDFPPEQTPLYLTEEQFNALAPAH